MKEQLLKCVIYCRVSTEKQEERDSLTNQIERCRGYAIGRGFEIMDIITDVQSGGDDNRPGYLRLKEMVNNRLFDVLLVLEFSRISRNAAEFLNINKTLRDKKIGLISIQQNFDTSTIMGKALAQLSAVISELEKDTVAERVGDRMLQLIKNGRYVSTPPFGYRYNEHKLLEIVEEEAIILRDVFNSFLNGETRNSIAERYHFDYSKVHRWLSSVIYIGKIGYVGGGDNRNRKGYTAIYDGLHQPIIDQATFDAVQAILNKNKKTRNRDIDDYVFTGITYCECGKKMYPSFVKLKKGDKIYPKIRYSCNSKKNKSRFQGKIECHQKGINQDEISVVVKKALLEKLKQENIEYKRKDDTKDKIKIINQQLDIVNSQLSKAKELFYADKISLEEYGKDSDVFNNRKLELLSQLEKLKANIHEEIDSSKIKELVLDKIRDIDKDNAKFKKIVRLAISKIIIKFDKIIEVEFNF